MRKRSVVGDVGEVVIGAFPSDPAPFQFFGIRRAGPSWAELD